MRTIDAIAIDRASVRTFDKDGYLHIADSLISSAQVNPYLGREIMAVDPTLQLDPERRYMMLRDPVALKAAVESMHGKPLLAMHKGVTAEEHDKEIVAGSVINPRWEDPDIRAELVVWPKEDIEAIKRGDRRDVSAGYRYRPIMEPGFYNGTAYDGRMVDIDFNHVALVADGRVLGAMVADAQIEDPNDVARIIDALKPEVAARLKDQLAADATLADVSKLLGKDESMATAPNSGIPEGKAKDADPDEFLKKKMSAEDKKTYDAMCASRDAKAKDAKAKDESEEEEERKKEKGEADKRAKDKRAKDDEDGGMDKRAKDSDKDDDEDEDDKKKKMADKRAKDKRAKDAEAAQEGMESLKSSGGEAAMDAAIGIALKRERAVNAAIRDAERDVLPKVGTLDLTFDSAEAVYVSALGILGEDKSELEALPLAALKSIFKRIPTPGSAPAERHHMAYDSAQQSRISKILGDAAKPGRA